jgi:diguanylate cyclase (GGDEF)-like protein
MLRQLAPLLVASIALAAFLDGKLQPLDDTLDELRFQNAPRQPTGDLVLVDIDAKSLSAIGRWPWPRAIHAEILNELTRLNAAAIGYDIDFSTTSTTEADRKLAEALEAANAALVLPAFNQNLDGRIGAGSLHANKPLDSFARHAWTASVNVRTDPDGAVRRFSLGEIIDGTITPSMAAVLGGYSGTLEGDYLIDFGIDARAFDRVSAIDLLQHGVESARIAGKTVIVGAAAVELHDLFRVPVFGVVSGATLQALATESILQGRMLRHSPGLSAAGLVLLAIGAFALRRLRWTTAFVALAGAALVVEASAFIAQQASNLVPETAVWHVTSAVLALAALLRETDLRRVRAAIWSTEARNTREILRRIVKDNFAGVIVADDSGTILAASRRAAETLGCPELRGRTCGEALPRELAEALLSAAAAEQAGAWTEQGVSELSYVRGSEIRTLEYFVRPSLLSGGMSMLGRDLPDRVVASLTFLDVTARRAAEARLAYLACFDALTGLPNRNQFHDRLSELLRDRPAKTCSVVFLDLDRFKNVNDTLGHGYGDLLLRAVAERIKPLLGRDDLAARFGGDEYAILCLGTGREHAERFARGVIEALGEPYDLEGHRTIIGVSVGIAFVGDEDTSPTEIMKRADTALYRAKAMGGNALEVYEGSMETALKARQTLEVELWDALAKEQFELHYQPQVDLSSQEIVGFEALLRWRHPTRGLVSPAEFVPVAEAVGLIEPLGGWVLHQACAAAARWPKPLKVAVNVSPVQFTRGNLRATVSAALAGSGLPAGRLDLEITESLFVNENKHIRDMVESLSAAGISFSIDDFGTGYSSLNYIRRFPIGRLKIDRSFVIAAPFDNGSMAIIRAVCAMAEGLGIVVTAEGVETIAQAMFLRQLGCNEGQGYLFGKPVPVGEIERMLSEASPPQRLSA